MPDATRRRRGAALLPLGLVGAVVWMVVVACGSETIDLLPPHGSAGIAGGGKGGSAGTDGVGGGGGRAGAESHAGSAGTADNGQGGSIDCEGFGCGGSGNLGGFGGTAGGPACNSGIGFCIPCVSNEQCGDGHCSKALGNICVACIDESDCKPGNGCDGLNGRCAPSCDVNQTCRDGRVCDPDYNICVYCIDDSQCENDGDEQTKFCFDRRCVECTSDTDCTRGDNHVCIAPGRCAECKYDKDCGANQFCNTFGRCE